MTASRLEPCWSSTSSSRRHVVEQSLAGVETHEDVSHDSRGRDRLRRTTLLLNAGSSSRRHAERSTHGSAVGYTRSLSNTPAPTAADRPLKRRPTRALQTTGCAAIPSCFARYGHVGSSRPTRAPRAWDARGGPWRRRGEGDFSAEDACEAAGFFTRPCRCSAAAGGVGEG